jgi:hypothetical protein
MQATGSLVAILTTFLSSAAMAATISVPTPSVPPPLIHPLPLKVGLCVSPALRAAHLREVKEDVRLVADETTSDQAQTWLLGDALVDTFATAMRAAFGEVVVIDGCTLGAALAQEVGVIVVPTLVEAESRSLGGHRSRHARVELHLTLQSTEGRSAVSWSVSGTATIMSGLWNHNRQELVGRALSAALLDGCARFIADLSLDPEVNGWLMAQSVSTEVPGNGTAVRNRSDMAILNIAPDGISPQSMVNCVSTSLSKQDNRIRTMPAQEAKNLLFPWLQESVLSFDPKHAAMLLSNTLLQQRSRESGLRYVVFLTQVRGGSDMSGPFFCGAGPGGVGCLGAARITRETTVYALIWDLERGRESQYLLTTKRAHDLLVGVVVPLSIPGGSSTKEQACHTMARKLLQVVREPDAVPEGSTSEASKASIWKSTADLTAEATAAEFTAEAIAAEPGARPPSCFDAFVEQSTDAPLHDEAPSSAAHPDGNVQTTDGIQWNDGASSVQDMVDRPPAVMRFGSIAVSDQFLVFAPAAGSQPAQTMRIPFTDVKAVRVDNRISTFVLLQTKADCRAAFQVLDVLPSVVKRRTDDLGKLIAQRLADSQESGPYTP